MRFGVPRTLTIPMSDWPWVLDNRGAAGVEPPRRPQADGLLRRRRAVLVHSAPRAMPMDQHRASVTTCGTSQSRRVGRSGRGG
jgi:hypothetical protein